MTNPGFIAETFKKVFKNQIFHPEETIQVGENAGGPSALFALHDTDPLHFRSRFAYLNAVRPQSLLEAFSSLSQACSLISPSLGDSTRPQVNSELI
jgi:hypothetical protein